MDSVSSQPTDDSASPPPSPARRKRRLLVLFGLAMVVAAGSVWGFSAWQGSRISPPPLPPLTAHKPQYPNTRPGVGYVGSERCAECHPAEAATFAEHPMGQSVSPANKWLPAQHKALSSFEASKLRYTVEREGDKVFHREFVADGPATSSVEVRAEISSIIGSGRQGQSFLVNRQGRLFQSPISWFVGKHAWNLSPSFERQNKHFSRSIAEACLFCHCNEAHSKPDTINEFVPSNIRLEPIGCERCHGPGELHVAAHRREDRTTGGDRTIINPRRLPPQLREAVCEQCHLQGEARIVHAGKSLWDYRPGLPLDKFVSIFVRPSERADSRKAVSHVEQMHLSRCFQDSAGKMGCISCHDPHVLPSEQKRVAWYRGRCLNCHKDVSCSLTALDRRRHNPADSCIDCHMPRGKSTNIAHTSITDHRIVRRSLADVADEKPADFVLVPFHAGAFGASDAGSRRDLGLALSEMTERAFSEPQRRQLAGQAWNLLEPVVERAPHDVAALEALGLALWKDKRSREALAVFDKALQRVPQRELTLSAAGLVALESGESERSILYWRRLLAINPHTWQSHAYYGQALALRKQWGEAVDACRHALRLNPFEIPTRMLLIDCLVHLGQKKPARVEFDTLLALRPPEMDKLRRWFDELMGAGR